MDYNNTPDNYRGQNPGKQPTNGLALASLILGILSVLLSLCYGIGILFGIAALVLGIISRKSTGGKLSGMALAGVICSICGIVIGIAFIVLAFVGFALLSDISQEQGFENIYDYINSIY